MNPKTFLKGLSIVAMFFTVTAKASLSGTYTINASSAASSTNYKNFASAVSDMISGTRSDGGSANGSGISASVVFNVANGVYSDQIQFTAITGASSSKTITFQSASGDSSKVILTNPSSTSATSNFTVGFSGASFISFKKMTISRTGTNNYGVVVEITGGSNYNAFRNCQLMGVVTTSTTNTQSIVYNASGNDSNNIFNQNLMRNGAYGFYWWGNSNVSPERNGQITNNILDSVYYMGMYVYYMDNLLISGNTIMHMSQQNAYGMYTFYNYSNTTTKNKIYMGNIGQQGMTFYYGNGNTSRRSLIANNMVSVGGTNNNYGMYIYYTSYTDLVYNSILNTSSNSNSYGLYFYSYNAYQTNNIINNCVANLGTGAAMYIQYYDVNTMDYNNWFAKGSLLGNWNGTYYATLAAWKTACGKDANARSANPFYVSNNDLHASSPLINGAAVPYSTITDDIDAQTRNSSTPDIGADEFTPPTNDAGVASIDDPSGNYCAGTKSVYVTLQNYGSATLTNVKINWKVNSTTQTAYTWTGSISPGLSAQVNIGNYSFLTSQTYVIKAWTSLPNGSTDGNNLNDTSWSGSLNQGLTGTYTIGGTSPDYSTITLAVADLIKYGVCGATVFNIRDGSYNEQVTIPQIAGTSATNTILFQSQSGDSSKVVMYVQAGTALNYVLQFSGVDYCTVKKITIQRIGNAANYYSRVVDVNGQSTNDKITNCRLIALKPPYYYYQHEIVYSSSDNDNNFTLSNNYLLNGSYAIYWFGTNTTLLESGTNITGNKVDSTMGNGNYIYYQDGLTITNNTFNNTQPASSNSTVYGLNLYYCSNIVKVTKNVINVLGAYYGNFGLYISQSSNASTSSAIIANNMISVGGTGVNNTYGIYENNSPYHNYYYNSVNIESSNYNSYGVFFQTYSGNTNIQNNISYNKGGGIAIYIYPNYIGTMDYNDWATTGSTLGSNNGTGSSSLSAWRTSTSKDANSVSTNPGYTSWNNLHASNPLVNNTATPISGLTDDIDGQTRSASTPDMGADEFTPPSNDAGVSSIDNPKGNYCAGSKNVMVTITNYGAATLTSCKVNWTVNGTTQTQYSYSGSIAPGYTASVNVGSYTFSSGTTYSIKAWTSSPNGTTDGNNNNDTAWSGTLKEGLNGTYTIGGTTPDYSTYSLAVADLVSKGICGSVTFIVRSGSYNEQFSIPQISGASSTNTITFQSQANDSSAVTLWYASGTGNNYVVQFNGADWVTFKKQTISRTGSNYNGVVLDFRGGASNNRIMNNRLIGTTYNSTTNANAIVYSDRDIDSANWFKNNALKNGAYGFYWFGVNTSSFERSTVIENNIFDSVYYMGCQLYYHDNISLKNNIIRNMTYTGNSYGIYAYYCANSLINSNNIYNFAGSGCYGIYANYSPRIMMLKNRVVLTNAYVGIYLNYCQSLATNRGLVANNFISVGAPASSQMYGLYDYYSSNTDYYHNSILLTNTNSASIGFYYYYHYQSNENIVNNISANTGGGLAVYYYNYNGTLKTADNNDWYTTGSILGWYNGNNYSNLTTWRTASTKDSNSVSLNPNYVSTTDLHVSHPSLNGTAKKLSLISDDYDGDTRNATTPDIGADEFTPPANDAGISSINSPNGSYCAGKQSIIVTLTNYGTNTLTSATINWSINGTTQTAYNWTGSLSSGSWTQVTIGTYTFSSGTTYSMKSWTTKPNGTTDGNNANDTSFINGMKEGMAGTYTIGGTSPDYATFTLAVADLNTRGVCGAVVFNVRDGSYNEQISIGSINGTSATNTVTFQSQSLDSTKATLWYASGSATNYTVQLNGADYITFKKLTIARTGTNFYGVVVELKSGANMNKFLNNRIIGTKYNSTNYYNAIVYSGNDVDSSNLFNNNLLKNGNIAFYMFGVNTTSPERYNVYSNNTIDSIYYMAFQLYYQDRTTVNNNSINNLLYTSGGYGVYLYYASNTEVGYNTVNNVAGANAYGIYCYYSATPNLHHNQLNIQNGSGIYLYYCQSPASSRGMVYNNMISVGGSTTQVYGINDYFYCTNTDYSYNSIYVTNTNSSSIGFNYYYHSGSTDNIRNNISYNIGGGLAVYIYNYNSTAIIVDNNDWISLGSNMGWYNGTSYANLANWQISTKKDSNSYSVNPFYVSNLNLHISNAKLNGTARVLSGISDDYDLQTRNASTPDIGADEFTPPATDAGISKITSPTGSYCSGKQNVTVDLTNFGLNTLSSVDINWSVNGSTQTKYSWTGSLSSGNTTNVTLGTFTFSSGTTYSIKNWTSNPNGTTDGNNVNDTSWSGSLKEGLSGTYTIGGTTPDYATFTLAVADLNSRGLCGPVVFNVRSGTYTEQIVINQIGGSSSTNTVTFQSQVLDSTAVTLTWPAGYYNNNNYVLRLNGADWVTFKKITLSRTTTNYYASVISIMNSASNNQFLNNRIFSNKYNTPSTDFSLVYSSSDNDTANTFRSNLMKYGAFGFYYWGVNNTTPERKTVIENNIMDSLYYMGIYMYYHDASTVRNNTITNLYYPTSYGIYAYYCQNGSVFDKNRVYISGDGYGMYLGYCNSTSSTRTIVSNNMVSVGGSGTTYGIYEQYNNYMNTYYNSIWTYGSSAGYAFYNSTNNNGYNNIVNNSFTNTGGGQALYIQNTGTSYINSIDFNNYFATGSNLGYWGGTTYSNLVAWKTGTGRDTNTLSVNPNHVAKNDLHTTNPNLNGKAFVINTITEDNDGQIRSTSTPDIGADEFTPPSNDAGVASIDNPYGNFCGGSQNVIVTIGNYGLNTITTLNIDWTVNGSAQTQYKWTGSLASGSFASVNIGSYNFSGTNYSLKIWTSSPNGAADGNALNDTSSVNNLKLGMSGTYTIGGSSPDYSSFTLAAADLTSRGVCGSVIFNVRNGIYVEQFSIGSVYGTSASKTVTFQSQSNDSTAVQLTYASSGAVANNYVVQLNGSDWITFRAMTISRSGTSYYGIVFDLKGGANNNTIKNNRIFGSRSNTTGNPSAVISSVSDNDSATTIVNNDIRYGSYGIYFTGVSTVSLEHANNISNNRIDSAYYQGIYFYYQDGGTISNNTIGNGLYPYNYYGIYGYFAINSTFTGNKITYLNSATNNGSGMYLYQSKGFVVTKNKVNMSSGYGIYLYFCQNDATKKGLCANNFATTSGTSSYTSYSYYWYYNTNTDYFYNSGLNTNSSTSFTTLYYYPSGSTDHVINNCFSNTGGGYAIYVQTALGNVKSLNYNNYYFTGTNLGYYSGTATAYTSLSAWQTATSRDTSSISINPQYFSNTDLHIKTSALKVGQAVVRVKDDVDGQGRPTVPTIGADEFTPTTTNDVAVLAIYKPVSGGCGNSASQVAVVLLNNGSATQTNIPIQVKITGAITATLNDTLKKSLYYSDRDTFYLTPTFSTNGGGTFYLKAYHTLAVDQDRTNDTATKTITVNKAPNNPTVTGASRCGAGTLNLKATNSPKIKQYWYAVATGGTSLYQGDIYTTPTLSTTTTYYVESLDSTGSCPSGRVAVTATINTAPSGAVISKGSTFNGLFNAGSSSNPDQVCVNGTAIYDLTPPTGFTNSQFGTKWGISNLALITANGTVSKDTATKAPGASNGTLTFTPGTASNDSTFILYVTIKNLTTGCDSSFTRYIYVQPKPKPSFTSGNGCVGNATVFTNTTAGTSNTYSWKFGDGGTSTSVSPSHTYAGAGTYYVTLTAYNAAGCSDTVQQKITVYASPTVKFGADVVCQGDSTSFTDTITTPSGTTIASIYYIFGDGGSATYSNPKHLYATGGNYTVWLVVTNSNGCKDSMSQNITVNAPPSTGYTYKDVCIGDSTFFTNTTSGATSYKWDFGDGNTSTSSASIVAHKYTATGAFTVKLTATSASGCVVSYSKIVNVFSIPSASFTTKDVCLGDSSRFTNTSVSSGNVTYLWDFGDGNTSTAKNPVNLYASSGSYFVKLTVTSAAGCSDFDTLTIKVNSVPSAKFAAKSVCDGDSVHFTDFSSGSGTMYYSWDFGDFSTSSLQNPVHLYASSGTYTVKLTTSYSTGCSSTFSTSVTVNPSATADFTTSDVCQGNLVTTTNKSSGGTLSYSWDFGDGSSKSTLTSPSHYYTKAGKYTITLVATNSGGCSNSKSIDVTVNEKPVAKFGFSGNCVKNVTQFTDSSTSATGLTYNWNFGDGGTSTAQNPTHTYQTVQNFQVTLIVTNTTGCKDTITRIINIGARPNASFSKSMNATYLATFTPADLTLKTYSWDFGDATTSTLTSPTHQYASSGKYIVKLTVTNANGCSQTYTDSFMSVGISETHNPLFNVSVQPNPFTISTTLHYSLEKPASINASVYDMTGRLVSTLITGKMPKGEHSATFDAANVPAGLYMLRLEVDGNITNREIIRLK